jgi:hypothetical protein
MKLYKSCLIKKHKVVYLSSQITTVRKAWATYFKK